MNITSRKRLARPTRCAYCHDDITGGASCVRCGAVMHLDCAAELRRCASCNDGRDASEHTTPVDAAVDRDIALFRRFGSAFPVISGQ